LAFIRRQRPAAAARWGGEADAATVKAWSSGRYGDVKVRVVVR
jgi:hypothetical protein